MGDAAKSATNPFFNFVSGGVGGFSAIVVGQPFDTIKVRLQTAAQPKPGELPLYSGTFDCLKKTISKEGFFALYKGMVTPLCGATPLFALFFFGSSVGKRLLQKPDKPLTMVDIGVAGMCAGVMITCITAPMERIKCLLQVQQGAYGSAALKYAGPWDAGRQLLKEGGIRSIYRGTCATLLRDVPASAAYLCSYEWLMRIMTGSDEVRTTLSPGKILLAGGVSGIANWGVAIMPDVLKSRLQTAPEGTYPNGIRDVFKELMRNEGILSLYRGFVPVMIRAFPANAACFMGVELSMKFLTTMSAKARKTNST